MSRSAKTNNRGVPLFSLSGSTTSVSGGYYDANASNNHHHHARSGGGGGVSHGKHLMQISSLTRAVEEGDLASVRRYIDIPSTMRRAAGNGNSNFAPISPFAALSDGFSVLHEAAYHNHLHIVRYLVEECEVYIPPPAASAASAAAVEDVVKYYRRQARIADHRLFAARNSDNDETPAPSGSEHRSVGGVNSTAAPPTAAPYYHAVPATETLVVGMPLLLEAEDGTMPIHVAAMGGAMDVLRYLMGMPWKGEERTSDGGDSQTPFHDFGGDDEEDREWWALNHVSVDTLTGKGWSCLHLTAQEHQHEATAFLLRHGASVSLESTDEGLYYAPATRMLKALYDWRAHYLRAVAARESERVVEIFKNKNKVKQQMKGDRVGEEATTCEALSHNHNLLLPEGTGAGEECLPQHARISSILAAPFASSPPLSSTAANVTPTTTATTVVPFSWVETKSTALHTAVRHLNYDALVLLLDKGADILAKDANGLRPIDCLPPGEDDGNDDDEDDEDEEENDDDATGTHHDDGGGGEGEWEDYRQFEEYQTTPHARGASAAYLHPQLVPPSFIPKNAAQTVRRIRALLESEGGV